MRQIFFERGLLVDGMSKTGSTRGSKPNEALSMVAVLGKQLDFKNVDPSLMVLVKRCGGVAIMLPKFHCQLNPIELVWGRSKYWVRRHCKYTIQCLRENVTKSYAVEDERLSLDIVQKYCRKVANFHSVYAEKHTGPDAVMKRREYRSHRKPAPSEFINPK